MKRGNPKSYTFLLPILLASALLSSCASTGPRLKPGLSFPELGAALDRKLPAAVGRRVPALQVALVEGGQIVYEKAFGLADRESGRKADTSTVFQVASISKSVTAWGALRLVQEGRLDLDAPVMAQEGRWRLPPSSFDASGVTPRRLLSHTAGLAAFGYPGSPPDKALPSLEESLSGDNEGKGRREPSRELRLVAAPGSAFSYTGGGYTLLQLLLEERSGQDFARFMKDAVLEPCGMASSSFAYAPTMAPTLAAPYDFFGKRLPNYLYTEKAAAGLYTTAGDLARLLNELYRSLHGSGGTVLDKAHAALLTEAVADSGGGHSMALGYLLQPSASGGRIINHSGSNRGWYCWYAMEIESGRGIVILSNSEAAFSLMEELSDSAGSILAGGGK
jgi:CubicO group peptidase (beta-lactamase class C family)